jgi:chaperone required for assembly of F1-ATPase|tara:strand:- start:2059 stop:3300 length:1242 start_codon:yes stop_codon:yes gene_type:complete
MAKKKEINIENTMFEVQDDHITYDGNVLKTPLGNTVCSKNPRLLDQIASELDTFDKLTPSIYSSWSLYSLQKDCFENPEEDMTMAVEDALIMDPTLRPCAGPEKITQFQKWAALFDFLKEYDIAHPDYVQSISLEQAREWIIDEYKDDEYKENHNKLICTVEKEIELLFPSQKACLLGLVNLSGSFIYSLLVVTNRCSPSEFANAVYAGEAINPKFYIDEGNLEDSRNYINELTLSATTAQNFIKHSNLDENHHIYNLIKRGENKNVEFKSTLRKSIDNPKIPNDVIENSVLKSILGFVNADGGDLFIGVNDAKEIIGIEVDGFKSEDKFLLHLKNIIKTRIVPDVFPLINGGEIHNRGGKNFCHVHCEKQKKFKAFWLNSGKDEKFYVRRGAATDELSPRKANIYIQERSEG